MTSRTLRLVLGLGLVSALPLYAQQADTVPLPDPSNPTPTAFDNPALVDQYQATITPEDLAAHLYLFASDYFEGRETATRGQKLAAAYLASKYQHLGLEPKGTAEAASPLAPDAYYQPFTVYGTRLKQASLEVVRGGDVVAQSTFSPSETDGQAFLTFGGNGSAEAGVVFAGYGISDAELGYDDVAALEAAGLETSGQWVLILRDEPLASDSTSRLPTADGSPSAWTSNSFMKLRALFGAGIPRGVLVVGDVGPRVDATIAQRARKAASAIESSIGNLSLNPPDGVRAYPPVYTISYELANEILAPSGRTVQQLQQEIDEELQPVVFDVPETVVRTNVQQRTFEATTENVVAFLEGSDPVLKDEVVVVTSHYDHIGVDPSLDGDQINNGADDDGSGTVTVLEIAEAFVKAKEDGYGPRRSLLFMNVSGEEKGLLGSAYFADVEPVVPLESIKTNLNIDMIGRVDPTHPGPDSNYVYIIGSKLISQELHDINARVNDVTGTNLDLNERFNSKDDPNRFYARSDHWNFGKHGIPFIFFFTGTHEDYHQPGDEAHKIEYERMARIGQLIFATMWQVANQDAPPAVSGTGFN